MATLATECVKVGPEYRWGVTFQHLSTREVTWLQEALKALPELAEWSKNLRDSLKASKLRATPRPYPLSNEDGP